MRRIYPTLWIVAWLFLTGCAERARNLALDPIGPPLSATKSEAETGNLMVYSALDPAPAPNRLPYQRQYTDYQLQDPDGKPLKKIHNQSNPPSDNPKIVILPVGNYRVLARANGYGEVCVPICIRPNQTTALHLEGSPNWKDRSGLMSSNSVRLPHGEIAGWRAKAGEPSSP